MYGVLCHLIEIVVFQTALDRMGSPSEKCSLLGATDAKAFPGEQGMWGVESEWRCFTGLQTSVACTELTECVLTILDRRRYSVSKCSELLSRMSFLRTQWLTHINARALGGRRERASWTSLIGFSQSYRGFNSINDNGGQDIILSSYSLRSGQNIQQR